MLNVLCCPSLLRELEWLEMESVTYRDGSAFPQMDRVLLSYFGLTQNKQAMIRR
jgi:hypothetical protein